MVNPFSRLADEKLMELYRKGENMAFEVIYLRHKGKVYSYLNRRLYDKGMVDDIFQSIFVKFHKSRKLYNSEYPLLKWLYTICRSELLDFAKKKKVELVEFEDHHSPLSMPDINESIDIDNEKLLSANEKLALKLRYYSDKDFSEISSELNTSDSNSRKLVSRGLNKLRAKYRGGRNESV